MRYNSLLYKTVLKFKLGILLLTTVFCVSCANTALNYTPTSELREEYRYVVSSEYFRAFYNLIPMGEGIMVKGAMQNISKTFASNVSIDVSATLSGFYDEKTYLFKNLGNIKMFSHKVFEFYIPSNNVSELVVNYEFLPVLEDTFFKDDISAYSETSAFYIKPIIGTLKLPLIKQPQEQDNKVN